MATNRRRLDGGDGSPALVVLSNSAPLGAAAVAARALATAVGAV